MHKQTRKQFNALLAQQAKINHVEPSDVSTKFSVDPAVEQKLEERVKESSGFLQRINVITVDSMKGDKVGIGVNSSVAGRTDTSGTGERSTRDLHATDERGYECVQTNFDTHLRYNLLDSWRHRPEFQTMYTAALNKQIARDRLMIGFNGKQAAKNTNRTTYPLLQDVNKGWLQDLREGRPEAVMSGVKIGPGGDYKNIDAAVYDVSEELIKEWHLDNPDMVVICGRRLLSDKYLSLISDSEAPTERNALDIIMTNKQVGAMPAARAPFFPANGFMITTLDNLSIYIQRETTRRAIIDNPKKDQVEDYRSVNQDYVIEDYEAAALCEGILLPDGNGGWA